MKSCSFIFFVFCYLLSFDGTHSIINGFHRHFLSFDQKIDHFDLLNTGTWKQYYYLHQSNVTRPDLALIVIGMEDDFRYVAAMRCSMYSQMFGGRCFGLEHRYFSNIGPKPSPSLRFLSSKQALQDLALFTSEVVKNQFNVNKTVVYSCSYGGSLAIWFRLDYPDLTQGAISESAPLIAKANFTEFFVRAIEVVKRKFSGPCFHNLITTLYNWTSIDVKAAEKIGFCPGNNSQQDLASVVQRAVTFNIEYFAQRNRKSYRNVLEHLCAIKDDIDMAREAVNLDGLLVNCRTNNSCINLKCAVFAQTKENKFWKRWWFQRCTEFGWFRPLPTRDGEYGAKLVPEFYKQCAKYFGLSWDSVNRGIEATNNFYGGFNMTSLRNTVIVNGENDPWSLLSLPISTKLDPSVENHLLPDAHHCPNNPEIIQKALNRFFDL